MLSPTGLAGATEHDPGEEDREMTQVPTEEDDFSFRKYIPFSSRAYNLFMLMHLTHIDIYRARHREVRACGLTYPEFGLLDLVDRLEESAVPAELARWLMRTPPAISGLLDRMERKGLVVREARTVGNRLKRVVMTDDGRAALARAREHDIIDSIVESISEDDFRKLWSVLERLKDAALQHSVRPARTPAST